MKERISILGCGWLGKPLAKTLVDKGFSVVGSTTQIENFDVLKSLGVKPVLLRFLPDAEGDETNIFFSSDVLIIAIPPRAKSASIDLYKRQLSAVIEEAKKGRISKLLYISSTSVYPDLNREVFEEDADKGTFLMQAEKLFDHTEFKTTIIRFGGLIGPGRHPGRFLAGKTLLTGGNSPVNIIHQKDCVEIIETIISTNKWGGIYNACAAHHPTRREFYTHAAKLLNLVPPTFVEDENTDYKIVSAKKLKRELNYRFTYDNIYDCLANEDTPEK